MTRKYLIGQTFGRLCVINETAQRKQGNVVYECKCECGDIAFVPTARLLNGTTKSCGCLHKENALRKDVKRRKHGMYLSPTYKTWQSMISRCRYEDNASFKYYGGKNINVCDEWASSFENFLQDMGVRPAGMTLDRIDSTKNYEKNNCRWATYKQQANNRTSNLLIMYKGEKISFSMYAETKGISHYKARKILAESRMVDGVFVRDI